MYVCVHTCICIYISPSSPHREGTGLTATPVAMRILNIQTLLSKYYSSLKLPRLFRQMAGLGAQAGKNTSLFWISCARKQGSTLEMRSHQKGTKIKLKNSHCINQEQFQHQIGNNTRLNKLGNHESLSM